MPRRADLHTAHWRKLRQLIARRDGWRCKMCSRWVGAYFEIDHIRPVEDNGERFDPANLQTLCNLCHRAKDRDDRRKRMQKRNQRWTNYINKKI